MNIVDCAAILPYYITLFFMPADDFGPLPSTTPSTASPESQLARLVVNATVGPAEEEEDGVFGSFSRIFQVFRIARIMRIFKLARRSVGLQAMAHTVRTSWKDLGLLFMLVGMGMLVFGSLLYYIENDADTTEGLVAAKYQGLVMEVWLFSCQVRLHPCWNVVGSADPHLARLRRLLARSALSH